MRYINYICDGDSVAFNAIKGLNGGDGPYGGDHEVVREQCVHHLFRKLGAALRALHKGNHTMQEGKKQQKASLGCKKFSNGFLVQILCGLMESIKRSANTSVADMR